jgi:hypothetical protein
MQTVCWFILLTGLYPLWQAWRINRKTSLIHAVNWSIVSWAGWAMALGVADQWPAAIATAGCYVALCLTGCAGIAVLGARRPGVGPWNLVVVGLLAVNVLPWAEGMATGGGLQLGLLRIICIAATIAVGILNYLPTRLAPAALLLMLGCFFEFTALLLSQEQGRAPSPYLQMGWLSLAYVPWLAYWSVEGGQKARSEFDKVWLDFRDRFGFVWGQRLREQFNRSAFHAGWSVVLRWQGLRLRPGSNLPEPPVQAEMLETLRRLMNRHGAET